MVFVFVLHVMFDNVRHYYDRLKMRNTKSATFEKFFEKFFTGKKNRTTTRSAAVETGVFA